MEISFALDYVYMFIFRGTSQEVGLLIAHLVYESHIFETEPIFGTPSAHCLHSPFFLGRSLALRFFNR